MSQNETNVQLCLHTFVARSGNLRDAPCRYGYGGSGVREGDGVEIADDFGLRGWDYRFCQDGLRVTAVAPEQGISLSEFRQSRYLEIAGNACSCLLLELYSQS